MKKKKVMMAMSGGVDSSVAAHLLIKEGYEVAGITMCIGLETQCGDGKTCCSPRDIEDAKKVCQVLGISHYVLDFSDEMETMVIQPFIAEYTTGRTPNPCIICNEYLKFGALHDKSLSIGFDYLATGHYARLTFEDDKCFLIKPEDTEKDQTYFLYSIPEKRLKNILFPLAGYSKDEVRSIAEQINLPVSKKPDSQDICFFPDGGSNEFFKNRGHEGIPGDIVHVNGKVLGIHKGIIFYTIGQRRGLGISNPEPLYVVSIDAIKNRIIVGERKFLKSRGLIARNINFHPEKTSDRATAKIRYAHKGAECNYTLEGKNFTVVFNEPQDSITPGQSVVLYNGNMVLGGGIIKSVFD